MCRRQKAKFDYYAKLSLKSDALSDDIKIAYRKMAVKYHLDKNPNDKEAENQFKECTEAYEILIDPDMRAQYDKGEHYLVKTVASSPDQSESAGFSIVDWLRTIKLVE